MQITIKEVFFVFMVFLANTVEAISGFAGTMLAMPAAMLLIGVKEAKVLLNMIAIVVSTTIAMKNFRDINWREVVKISAFMLIGMAGGLYLFSIIPVAGLAKIYGIFIMCIAVKELVVHRRHNLSSGIAVCILLGAGIIHGMFLSGGALLVLYAVAKLKDKTAIRATLAPVWLILNTIILAQDIYYGNFSPHIAMLFAVCILPLLSALVLGNVLHKKMRQGFFEKLTYALLIISGIILLVQ